MSQPAASPESKPTMPPTMASEHSQSIDGTSRRSRSWTSIALLLGVGVVLYVAIWPAFRDIGPVTFDEGEYSLLARHIVEYGEFSIEAGKPISRRPPLYSAFVAGIYRIFGIENFQAVRLAQIGLLAASAWIVYCLGLDLFGERVGFWAAAMTLFYPSLAGHCYLLMTESLFTFLFCSGTLLLQRCARHGSMRYAIVAGAVMGLASLTRSVMWPFVPIGAAFLAFAASTSRGRRWGAALVFSVSFAAVLLPWAVRNTRLNERLTIVDSQGGMILNWSFQTVGQPNRGVAENRPAPNETPQESNGANPTGNIDSTAPAVNEAAIEGKGIVRSLERVARNPLQAIGRILENFSDFWRLDRELIALVVQGHYGQTPRWLNVALAVVIAGYFALLLMMSAAGAAGTPRVHWRNSLAAILPALHVCAVHTVVYGHSRYHIPVMPVLTVFSAVWLTNLRRPTAFHRRWQVWLGAVACLGLIAIWGRQLIIRDLPDFFR